MLENKIKQIKKFELKKIIFPAILLAYFALLSLLLLSSARFFTHELNLALATDDGLDAAQNQPGLDLAGYSLLEKKFRLTPYVPPQAPAASEPEILATSTASGTPALEIMSSSTSVIDKSPTTTQIESANTRPLTISILNSTKTPGLAKSYKIELEAAGWPVASIGNYSPVLETTTINLSPGIENHPDIEKIKALLPEIGLLYIENRLPAAGKSDLEIIIGDNNL